MFKNYFLAAFAAVSSLTALAQTSEQEITFTTAIPVGNSISFSVEAFDQDRDTNPLTVSGLELEDPTDTDWWDGKGLTYRVTEQTFSIKGEFKSISIPYAELTAVDASKAPGITSMTLSNNSLTSLDLSANTALTSLYVEYNQIASLDLSACIKLLYLTASNNMLTSLDVTPCTMLYDLIVNHNSLSSLTLSPSLTNLSQVFCHKNDLTDVAMTAVIANLPTSEIIYESDKPILVVFSEQDAMYDYRAEGNVCTTTNVQAAKQKNWRVQYYSAGGNQYPYEGSEPTTGISSAIVDDNNSEAVWYTIEGRRISTPTKNGLYISKGRKIAVQ